MSNVYALVYCGYSNERPFCFQPRVSALYKDFETGYKALMKEYVDEYNNAFYDDGKTMEIPETLPTKQELEALWPEPNDYGEFHCKVWIHNHSIEKEYIDLSIGTWEGGTHYSLSKVALPVDDPPAKKQKTNK